MKLKIAKKVVGLGFLAAAFCLTVHAQEAPAAAGKNTDAPATSAAASSEVRSLERAFNDDGNWYFSWGYSRQQYAPSDIHISQPSQGNDFMVHKATASDYPADFRETIDSIFKLDLTSPQENIRIGKFLNAEKTFAIELNYDHSKYQVDRGQSANVSGTITTGTSSTPSGSKSMVLSPTDFDYALHNGLNHLMINAVWFHHLDGPKRQPGELQLISRLGAGILLPHADNVILGNANQVGPKGVRVCCFGSEDWWQVNGWTVGAEVGLRYRFYKSMYFEVTQKFAYGALRGVPVFQGTADQTIWMSEQVFSTGFLF
jgi:hypothetical protein